MIRCCTIRRRRYIQLAPRRVPDVRRLGAGRRADPDHAGPGASPTPAGTPRAGPYAYADLMAAFKRPAAGASTSSWPRTAGVEPNPRRPPTRAPDGGRLQLATAPAEVEAPPGDPCTPCWCWTRCTVSARAAGPCWCCGTSAAWPSARNRGRPRPGRQPGARLRGGGPGRVRGPARHRPGRRRANERRAHRGAGAGLREASRRPATRSPTSSGAPTGCAAGARGVVLAGLVAVGLVVLLGYALTDRPAARPQAPLNRPAWPSYAAPPVVGARPGAGGAGPGGRREGLPDRAAHAPAAGPAGASTRSDGDGEPRGLMEVSVYDAPAGLCLPVWPSRRPAPCPDRHPGGHRILPLRRDLRRRLAGTRGDRPPAGRRPDGGGMATGERGTGSADGASRR